MVTLRTSDYLFYLLFNSPFKLLKIFFTKHHKCKASVINFPWCFLKMTMFAQPNDKFLFPKPNHLF